MKLFRIFIFVFLYTLYFVLCTKVNAQDCTDTNDPEFHSLRPYPRKPCMDAVSETATFCGDSLTITDNIPITYNPGTDNCVSIPGGKVRCTYSVPKNRNITIGLSEAELPIMGNTEDVINSTNPIDPNNSNNNMPPEQRVNDYVSWYLNGIFGRAEYSFPPINTTIDAPSIPDFSGPINKLLPQEVQQQQRAQTVKNAKVTRHNQIVGCTFGINTLIPIPGWDQLFGFPIPCYIKGLSGIVKDITVKERRLSNWGNHIPPVRSDFDNYTEYYKKYQEWRGKMCFSITLPHFIPVIGGMTVVLCGENPLSPNFYSNLYQYIPLSSTEDRKGEVTASGNVGSAPGVTISNVSTSFTNATLYFAHMQEATELASTLQDTFAYKGADKFAAGNSVPVNTAGSCKIVDVRSNAGDDLLPTPTSITGNIAYTATFTCDFDLPTCSGKPLPPNNRFCETEYSGSCVPLSWTCTATFFNAGCPEGYKCGYDCSCDNPPTQTCTKAIPIIIATTTKTPLADKIWAQLVAGTSSVFRRIFPKLGSGSQIGEVKDIPASTKVTYSGDFSGTGDLYFPHIGGISEYFLKGIQTMLRPKGYGEAISFGAVSNGQCIPGEGNVDAAIADAASKYGVPAGLLQAIFQIEGAEYIANPNNYVCQENAASAAGVMQITSGAYQLVTCENERMADSLAACSEPGKLSRCVIHDAFELAARVLLSKIGLWSYSDCHALGTFPNNKQSIYDAACRYYGSYSPDALTIHAAQQFGLPDPNTKNYCDVVCYLMGLCPPFPSH